MQQIVLVIHLMLALGLVGTVLLQRSEGGGLGIGGSSGGGGGGLMNTRSTANFLTRATAVLAAMFFVTSIGLAILAGGSGGGGRSLIVDGGAPVQGPAVPAEGGDMGEAPLTGAPDQPTVPTN